MIRHKHKNLLLLALSVVGTALVVRLPAFQQMLVGLKDFGLVGVFAAGLLFSSSFTVSVGAVILVVLARDVPPWQIAVAAGLGGVAADLTIFHVIRDDLADEIVPLYKKFGGNHLTRLLHTRYFRWTLPVIGALIIMSPLPDELGVSLMDIAGMSSLRFALVSFALNATGMFSIALASRAWRI